jgi:uncharacterized lipoprotein
MIKKNQMKTILMLLAITLAACSEKPDTEQRRNKDTKEQNHSGTFVPMNNGSKWKADRATKQNVAEMAQIVNNNIYADAAKRKQLYVDLQTRIDTLIKQCTMQGPEHDALHVWLEKVLKDMKKLKTNDNEYSEAYASLKKDIVDFNRLFE